MLSLGLGSQSASQRQLYRLNKRSSHPCRTRSLPRYSERKDVQAQRRLSPAQALEWPDLSAYEELMPEDLKNLLLQLELEYHTLAVENSCMVERLQSEQATRAAIERRLATMKEATAARLKDAHRTILDRDDKLTMPGMLEYLLALAKDHCQTFRKDYPVESEEDLWYYLLSKISDGQWALELMQAKTSITSEKEAAQRLVTIHELLNKVVEEKTTQFFNKGPAGILIFPAGDLTEEDCVILDCLCDAFYLPGYSS